VLDRLRVQCERAEERQDRLMQLLQDMQRQQQLALEREARLLDLLTQAQVQS